MARSLYGSGNKRNANKTGNSSTPQNIQSTLGTYNHHKDNEMSQEAKSASQMETAKTLLDKTFSIDLGINTPTKMRQLNISVYTQMEKGFIRALNQLNESNIGSQKTAYGLDKAEYEKQILPSYEKIYQAFTELKDSKDTFDVHTYISKIEALLSDVNAEAKTHNNLMLLDAHNFLREAFATGVTAFYEKEGLANPINVSNFLKDKNCYQHIDDLLPDNIELDPHNPDHQSLLLIALELYKSDTTKYANNLDFKTDLVKALNDYGSDLLPLDSTEHKVKDSFEQMTGEINKIFEKNEKLESFENSFNLLSKVNTELEEFEKLGNHLTGAKPDQYTDDYKEWLFNSQKSASAFRDIAKEITKLINSLNASLSLSPAIDVSLFIDSTPSKVEFKDLSNTAQTLEYPTLRFSNMQEFRDLFRSITIPAKSTSPSQFNSIDSMGMSISKLICKRNFKRAGKTDPSSDALNLAAIPLYISQGKRASMSTAMEDFGRNSQKFHNLNIPIEEFTYEQTVEFAVTGVLKLNPGIDGELLRKAFRANSIQEFDEIITRSPQTLNQDVISKMVAFMQTVYSGDHKTTLNGKQCILAITRGGFAQLHRQISIFTNGYGLFKATQALNKIKDQNMTDTQKSLFMLEESRKSLAQIQNTAAIISQGVSTADTLAAMKSNQEYYIDKLYNQRLSYEDFRHKLIHKYGRNFQINKNSYRKTKFFRSLKPRGKKVFDFSSRLIIKPLTKLFIGIPLNVLDAATGRYVSHYGAKAFNYVFDKNKKNK